MGRISGKIRLPQTLKFHIMLFLSIVIVVITVMESYFIMEKVTSVLRQGAVETQVKNNEQVLYGIDQYFGGIAAIARKPGSSMDIIPILQKYPEDVNSSQILSDQYTAQMFMFREIMMQNQDFESVLIYHERQDRFYALSDTYLLQQDRQYDFSISRADYLSKLSGGGQGESLNYISGVRPSAMLILPKSDYVVTYIQQIMMPASIHPFPLGAFFINIDADAFQTIYDRYSADSQSEFYILDRENNIITCSNKSRQGMNIGDFVDGESMTEMKSSFIADQTVYTFSSVSKVCGWRVLTASDAKMLFAHERDILHTIILGTAIMLILEFSVIWWIVSRFTKPITSIKRRLAQVAAGDMTVRFDVEEEHPVDEVREMNLMLQEMLDRINQLIRRIYSEEDEKRKLEMSVLQSQITPHFIYNTLSRIQWMASMQQADNIADMLGAFSGILSYCSRNTDYYVSLAEEIRFIREYVKIMQLKLFGEVEVEYRIPHELMDVRVLRLLLQPIVENAFLHAFDDDGMKQLKLAITCSEENGRLILRVADNGKGIRAEVLKTLLEDRMPQTKDSIALNNIQKRIRSHYGDGYGLSVESIPDIGTTVMIVLPLQHET